MKCVKKLKNTLSIVKYWINTDVKYKMKKFDKILFEKFRSNTKIATKSTDFGNTIHCLEDIYYTQLKQVFILFILKMYVTMCHKSHENLLCLKCTKDLNG